LETAGQPPAAGGAGDELPGWGCEHAQAVGDGVVPVTGGVLEQLGGDGQLPALLEQQDGDQDGQGAAAQFADEGNGKGWLGHE